FLRGSVALPRLPSFPTRRSSDLLADAFQQGAVLADVEGLLALVVTGGRAYRIDQFLALARNRFHRVQTGTDRAETGLVNAGTARSEEHTSELQSRENLVCRLLLE